MAWKNDFFTGGHACPTILLIVIVIILLILFSPLQEREIEITEPTTNDFNPLNALRTIPLHRRFERLREEILNGNPTN